MSAAYTPAPWHVEDPMGDGPGDAPWIVANGASQEVYDWRCVAIVTSDDPDESDNPLPIGVAERGANARLIAAAPDLLGALQEAVKRLGACARYAGNDEEYVAALLAPFNAAIARATGAA